MKTLTAILLHVGVGALQAVATASDPKLSAPWFSIPAQVGLMALQGYLAKKNSESAPDGQPLSQTVNGNFVSPPKPGGPTAR